MWTPYNILVDCFITSLDLVHHKFNISAKFCKFVFVMCHLSFSRIWIIWIIWITTNKHCLDFDRNHSRRRGYCGKSSGACPGPVLADRHTCSLPLGNLHYIWGKRTFLKHAPPPPPPPTGLASFSFFDSHYPFCTSQNWNWFWVSKYVFFVSFCNLFFW